jgi:hypothetical protein
VRHGVVMAVMAGGRSASGQLPCDGEPAMAELSARLDLILADLGLADGADDNTHARPSSPTISHLSRSFLRSVPLLSIGSRSVPQAAD